MKILRADQIRELDAYTIKHEPIASIDLMERAAGQCAGWVRRHMQHKSALKIFCGMGNNGGDGLAMARMLAKKGLKVVVFVVKHAKKASEDFLINEKRLQTHKHVKVEYLDEDSHFPEIHQDELVIDAILGSGLARPLEGLLARLVSHINASPAEVVSIDMPTGLFAEDNRSNDLNYIIRADYTLSFQMPKLAFMMPLNEQFAGQWFTLDIGLHPEGIRLAETSYFYLHASEIRSLYRHRKKFSHKGHYGHAFLMSGSYGKIGAAVLAARATMRTGAGLLTVQLPHCGYEIMQTAVPEAMCHPGEHPHLISEVADLEGFNAICAGPGIGTHEQTARALKVLIQNASVPMVLDADALNILAENPTWCGFLPKGSIFTPHPGEFDRLAGKTTDDHDRLEKAIELAHRFQVHVVLKGAHTAVVCPDGRSFFNSTGNPGMASGGSGDVLAGMILGWLAQNYSPLYSCLMAVYLHGRAGDLAAGRKGFEGLIASDIVEQIPKAIRTTMGGYRV